MARTTAQIRRKWNEEMLKEQKRQYRHDRKIRRLQMQKAKADNKISGRFMNRIVIADILAALIFTVVMIVVFIKTGSEPSTLIQNVFQFLSVEGGVMGLIKVSKTLLKSKENKEDKKQDNPSELTPPDDEETEE